MTQSLLMNSQTSSGDPQWQWAIVVFSNAEKFHIIDSFGSYTYCGIPISRAPILGVTGKAHKRLCHVCVGVLLRIEITSDA